jgi:hypothetical protein
MSLNEQEYDYVQRLAVEEATALVNKDDGKPDRHDDSAWDKWHDRHFGNVLHEIDNGAYSYLDAREISEVCSEVESDVRHGDILGL